MFFGCSSLPRVWVVGFGLVNSLSLVCFYILHFFLFTWHFWCMFNPQTLGARLEWGWLSKTLIFDHFPVDSTSHLHTLYCKTIRALASTLLNSQHSSKVLDTEDGLDRKLLSSGRMLLWQLSVWTEYQVIQTDARDPISLT